MTKETKQTKLTEEMEGTENLPKQRILLFPVNPRTMEPNMESIAIFPNMCEALKAKAFLKRSGMFVILLSISEVNSKEEFQELWKDRVKNAMLGSLGIQSHS